MAVFKAVYNILWEIWSGFPCRGQHSGPVPAVMILIPAGVYFTIRTRFLPFRLFPEMIKVTLESHQKDEKESISGLQALIVSTAAGGYGQSGGSGGSHLGGRCGRRLLDVGDCPAGLLHRFHESTLAQLYKEKDPLYGGYRGGPAYYLHHLFMRKKGEKSGQGGPPALGDGLPLCTVGSGVLVRIDQVTSNSISAAFENAFAIPPIWSTTILVALLLWWCCGRRPR